MNGVLPDIDPDSWVAPTADVIGRVRLAQGASIWFGAVLRGDNELIDIGQGSNVQDLCVLHTDMGGAARHRFALHDRPPRHLARLQDRRTTLIGMGAIILNHAVIGAPLPDRCPCAYSRRQGHSDGSLSLAPPARLPAF